MKALVCRALGDPTRPASEGGALAWEDAPSSTSLSRSVPPGGLRVRVAAAALNFADLLMVRGLYQEKPALPFVPGGEFAGEVVEVGADVAASGAFSVGQKVAGCLVGGGAMAEEVVVPRASGMVFPVPPEMDPRQAAAFPVAYGTSHVALVHRARLRSGQSVLVLGAAGGVGLAAVQIAKAAGATVVAVARGAAKCAALRDAGADVVIDSDALDGEGSRRGTFEGLKEAVAGAGFPTGVDVLYDPVGGDGFKQGLRCVAWGGQVLTIGFASGEIPKLPLNLPLVKNITVHGVYWGSHARHAPGVLERSMEDLLGMMTAGKLRVNVSHAYPMKEAHLAFGALAGRKVVGKVVLVAGGGGTVAAAKL